MFVFPQVYIHRSVGASLPPVDGATHSEGPVVHGREATHARPPRLLAVLPLRSALSTRHIRGKYKLQNNCKITESICISNDTPDLDFKSRVSVELFVTCALIYLRSMVKMSVDALYSQGQPNEVALARIRETYWTALKMNWKVWTPLQYINVKYIPQMVSESEHKPVIYDRRVV